MSVCVCVGGGGSINLMVTATRATETQFFFSTNHRQCPHLHFKWDGDLKFSSGVLHRRLKNRALSFETPYIQFITVTDELR